MTWKIQIERLETQVSVGIHAHEKKPQRLLVDATVEARYAARPKSISDCFNYENIHTLVTKKWPSRPHVDLLETYVTELLEYIFRVDAYVTKAAVCLSKPDVFKDAKSAGVGAEWTRADFERIGKE